MDIYIRLYLENIIKNVKQVESELRNKTDKIWIVSRSSKPISVIGEHICGYTESDKEDYYGKGFIL